MYERYEKLLKARGLKTSDISKKTNLNPSTFSHWKKGDYQPKRETMQKIADALQFPVDYFYTSIPEAFDLSKKYDRSVYEVSAGEGRINDIVGSVVDSVIDRTLEGMEERIATVKGDSMIPSLQDGDVVHIIETTDVEPSDFALVRINGSECTIKHVQVTDDGVWVRGENPDAYTDTFYTVQQCITLPVQIVGKAISFERKL